MLSRILVCVGLAVVGAVFGALGTVTHGATVGSLALPWGIVVALVALGCLLAGLRLLSDGRLHAACAAAGALVAVGVLSQESFGGSVLVMNDAVGWVWIGGAVVICLLTVGWPKALAVN